MGRTTVIESDELRDDRPDVRQGDSVAGYVEEQGEQNDLDVLAGLRELDGAEGIRWKVFRLGAEDPNRNGYLDDIGGSQLTTALLRDRYGGGKYRVRGHYPNGQFAAHRTVEIAADAPVRDVHGSEGVNASGFNVQEFLAAQEVREETRRERTKRDRMELLTVMGPLVAPIVAAMIANKGPDIASLITAIRPPPPPDPIQQLAALKALQGDDSKVSPMDVAFKLLEKFQDMAPAGDGGAGWMDLAREAIRAVAPSVGPMLEAKLAQSSVTAVTNVLPQSPASAVPIAIASSAGTASEDPKMFGVLVMLPWLRGQLEMAVKKAAGGSDPGLIAERILDDVPQGVKPAQLAEFIARDDWWEQLQTFDARVAAHTEWFAEMREAMMEQFAQPAPDVPTMTVTPVEEQIDRPQSPPTLGGES